MSYIVNHCEKLTLVNDDVSEIDTILSSLSCITEGDRRSIITHLVKDFGRKKRKDGTPYVNHLKHTLLNVLSQYGENISRIPVLVAILHDSIEDTRFKFEKLRDVFGIEVAICVDFLSKKAFWKFIGEVPDISQEESQAHHAQLFIIFKLLEMEGITHEYQIDEDDIPDKLKEYWKNLKSPYKKSQQEEYFGRFTSRKDMRLKLVSKLGIQGIHLEEIIIDEIVDAIISVKLADRLHNLGTLTENHQKKLDETLSYLKNIIQEIIDTPIGNQISTEISWLQHTYSGNNAQEAG
ncbi:hypothetical protein LAT59_03960 [Candidatus Gracilibacteria bacterium]|nr:hypothetical protein [Candidatus Gracilibacteria bacterium]